MKSEKFSRSITAKGLVIAALTLLMLIPSATIRKLIRERQERSEETIQRINAKWSFAQTLSGPVLNIPYTETEKDSDGKLALIPSIFTVTPETLDIRVKLSPEERYYGIYKTILYRSEIEISGEFDGADFEKIPEGVMDLQHVSVTLGLSDQRGVEDNPNFTLDGVQYTMDALGKQYNYMAGRKPFLSAAIDGSTLIRSRGKVAFNCTFRLKGSSEMNFIPMGKTTKVHMEGAWKDPGFIGNFSPDHDITGNGFTADWTILRFNRAIPDTWTNKTNIDFDDTSFGVNLIDQVDHYLQNERAAKYAFMFIALTFVVFFFVEVLTRRKIHPVQYLLVGIALTIFYTLLLSISEQLNFAWAYLIAGVATIALITVYAHSVFKNYKPTVILALVLVMLYSFLYMVLQLEDVALLIGSIGLFVILGVVMYLSRRVNWYASVPDDDPAAPPPLPAKPVTPPPVPKPAAAAVPPPVKNAAAPARPVGRPRKKQEEPKKV